ncbi:MAG: general secretion pathway protein GspK [Deltaproteobacteria bacterium]|nr:general secretion pathway protein GspK [Deltaproteobacteria bacterium]
MVGGQRGVALMIVLLAIVILAAAVSEFSFNTRVNLRMTRNVQNEVKAYFHARSGIMVALFSLQAKELVDKMIGLYAGLLGGVNTQSIEIWRAIKPLCDSFSSSKLSLYGIDLVDLEGVQGMGVDAGESFTCDVDVEDGKINLNQVKTPQDKQTLYIELRGLFMQQFHSELFNENERLVDEVIANIIDWADADENRSQFENGMFVEGLGGGGEKAAPDGARYKTKNAFYDTVDEVRLVEGVTEGIYCLLKDRVTVYNTEKLNVNSADLETVKGLVCSHMVDGGLLVCNPQLRAQGIPTPIDEVGYLFEICRNIKNQLFTPPFSSAQAFTSFFAKLSAYTGTQLPLDAASLQQKVGTRGRVWRVTATGRAGPIERTLTAVVDTSTARIVYWRE